MEAVDTKSGRTPSHTIAGRESLDRVTLRSRDELLEGTRLEDLVRCAQKIRDAGLMSSVEPYSALKFDLAEDVVRACQVVAIVELNDIPGMDDERARAILRTRSGVVDESLPANAVFRWVILTAKRLNQMPDPNLQHLLKASASTLQGLQMRAMAYRDEQRRTSVVLG